jgi:hypothetical protein
MAGPEPVVKLLIGLGFLEISRSLVANRLFLPTCIPFAGCEWTFSAELHFF